MLPITYEGFNALVTAQVTGKEGQLFLEFVGNTTSARAIAAALLSLDCRKYASGIQVDNNSVHLERHANYKVLNKQATRQGAHGKTMRVTLMHNAVTTQNTEAEKLYFIVPQGQDEAVVPEGFFRRLKLAVKIPLLPEWRQWLWEEGQEQIATATERGYGRYGSRSSIRNITTFSKTLVQRIERTYGVDCWEVHNDQAAWVNVVRRHFGLSRKLAKTDYDDYSDGAWRVVRKGTFWELWRDGQQLMVNPEKRHGSDRLEEAIAIAEYQFGEKLELEGRD